jgi:SpoVK/Ycf46/Vps4 family AAA+-type ATPase
MSSMSELSSSNSDDAYYFERDLKRILRYASTWRAVILLDEADVFLEKRLAQGGDSSRNALVAIFLKHLEYFSGMIFLTTNRVDAFDPAMKSRINLALSFEPPGIEMRRQLWLKHLGKIATDDLNLDLEEDIDEFTREKLNGREISYAINTARTLARYEKKALGVEHVQTVLKVKNDFDKDLRRTGLKMSSMSIDRQNSILADEAAEYKS